MAYGLRIKNADGDIIFNTADVVARIRYSAVVSSGASSNTILSDISGKTTYAFAIPLDSGLAHAVSVSGTTLSWTAQSNEDYSSSDSLIILIIID